MKRLRERDRTDRCSFAAVLAMLMGSTQAHAEDWPAWGKDPLRHRASAERSGAAFAADWRLAVAGTPDATKAIVSSPAIADGFVAVGGLDGHLRVFRATDGQPLWSRDMQGEMISSPVIHRGLVLAASAGGHLVALRVQTGEALWKTTLGGLTHASPALIEDASGQGVLVAPGFPAQKLMRVDVKTGKVSWETGEGVAVAGSQSSVAVWARGGKSLVLLGSVGGVFQAFDGATGNASWTYEAGGEVYLASPAIADGVAYAVTGGAEARLHAIDLSTGKAVAGWPVALGPAAEDGLTGEGRLARYVAKSSPIIVGDEVLVQLRFIDLVDTNGDGEADTYRMRERLFALSRTAGQVKGTVLVGTRNTPARAQMPTMATCPTPASFAGGSGAALLVVASTLEPTVRIVDARSRQILWSGKLAAATRGSPTFANGRLFVGTDEGVLEAFASTANRPPDAPQVARESTAIPIESSRLRFAPRGDLDGDMPTTILRLDSDGEVLEDWEHELRIAPGAAEAKLPALPANVIHAYAFRAEDSQGALSAWSRVHQVRVVPTPSVSIAGQTKASLAAALAEAKPGDVVALGAGTFVLQETVRVPAGVSLVGAGPQATAFAGEGVAVGLTLSGRAGAARTTLSKLSVTEAVIGVDATDANVELRNVVLHHNDDLGMRVGADANAELVNLTIVGNRVGVSASGATFVRNSLVLDNDVGLSADRDGRLVSRYNDLFENDTAYQNVAAGETDLSVAVAFVNRAQRDYHLLPAQPTTDRGDPADPFAEEPMPNGGRINLGAYGNTPEAERSEASPPGDGQDGGPSTGGDGSVTVPADGGGCGCHVPGSAPRAPRGAGWLFGLAVAAIAARRWRRR